MHWPPWGLVLLSAEWDAWQPGRTEVKWAEVMGSRHLRKEAAFPLILFLWYLLVPFCAWLWFMPIPHFHTSDRPTGQNQHFPGGSVARALRLSCWRRRVCTVPRGGFACMWRWPASFGSVIVSWGSTLLFSYSDTDMCLQVHVNLTVFEKHGCRISRNRQMNLPGGHEQILHVGKYDSLTCHLNFPKSCVLDSVKWYKVKKIKGFSYWYFLFFSLKPTCFFNLSCIFKAKLVKRLCISDRFVS